MSVLYLYDDHIARRFEPFALTRPIATLTAGIRPIAERWRQALGAGDVRVIAGARHAAFGELPCVTANDVIPTGAIVANSRFVPELIRAADRAHEGKRAAACSMWRGANELAAVRLRADVPAAQLADGRVALDDLHAGTGAIGDLRGWWLEAVWDFIRLLPEQLASDIAAVVASNEGLAPPPAHATVLGAHPVLLLAQRSTPATVEPHVVFDAGAGPILIGEGAHIRAFTRIVGPCYVGPETQIVGGDITGCSIGPVCKVRGEISNTVVLGYSNKGHDGFVGHSYLGRWVNLGAGTITSNLKNTYGTVALWTPDGVRDSGLQFLGTLFGDHVKTGIGLRLTTGTVLGAGANVFDQMPPKVVAPFSWGGGAPYDTFRFDKFADTARRVMGRRHVELTEHDQRHLAAAHAARWSAEPQKK